MATQIIQQLQSFPTAISYSCATADKVSTDAWRRAVPLRQLSLLRVYRPIVVNGFKTIYNAIKLSDRENTFKRSLRKLP